MFPLEFYIRRANQNFEMIGEGGRGRQRETFIYYTLRYISKGWANKIQGGQKEIEISMCNWLSKGRGVDNRLKYVEIAPMKPPMTTILQ